jgi:hypothetical protein
MFCPNCEKSIPDGSAFCPECVINVVSNEPQQSIYAHSSIEPPLTGEVGTVNNKLVKIPTRMIAKIAFLAALVCFAFPFISVSCSTSTAKGVDDAGEKNYRFEAVYNGYNFIFPSTISEKNVKDGLELDQREETSIADKGEEYGSKEGANPWLITTAICCIAGCVVLFLKRDKLFTLVATGCSIVSLICLVIFRVDFSGRYFKHGKTDLEDLGQYLKVNTKFGFVLCILMVIIALLSCMGTFIIEKFMKPKQF